MIPRAPNLTTANSSLLATAERRLDALAIAALALFTILSRIPYIPADHMGYDGPLYINALKLDSTYAVPQPGNIGYVLLGKFVSLFTDRPHFAFAIVGIAVCALAIPFVYLLSTLIFRRSVAFGIALGDDLYLRVVLHAIAEVDELAIDLAGERGARKAGADGAGDLGYGDGSGKRLRRAVGETDIQHASVRACILA